MPETVFLPIHSHKLTNSDDRYNSGLQSNIVTDHSIEKNRQQELWFQWSQMMFSPIYSNVSTVRRKVNERWGSVSAVLTQPSMIPTRLSAVDRMDYGIVIVEIKVVLSKSELHNLDEDDQALEMRTKLLMPWRLHEQSVQQELYWCDSFFWF